MGFPCKWKRFHTRDGNRSKSKGTTGIQADGEITIDPKDPGRSLALLLA